MAKRGATFHKEDYEVEQGWTFPSKSVVATGRKPNEREGGRAGGSRSTVRGAGRLGSPRAQFQTGGVPRGNQYTSVKERGANQTRAELGDMHDKSLCLWASLVAATPPTGTGTGSTTRTTRTTRSTRTRTPFPSYVLSPPLRPTNNQLLDLLRLAVQVLLLTTIYLRLTPSGLSQT